ncbi:MAG TPA: hypothetical protein VN203_17735, partial [Candidatus Acidoferrum sp.]|nr:hypothetical protein [Candidatus Acidoferrum sp.]
LAAILLLIPALLHSQSPGTPIELGPSAVPLTGPWKFSPGDSPWVNGEPVWAQPGYDDSHWDTMDLTPQAGSFDVLYGSTGYVPGWTTRGYPNLTGYAWYRLRIRIDSHGRPVALEMPLNVDDGCQVFANGRYLGEVAQFGPHGVVLHYAVAVVLPPLQLTHDGSVELAIRVFMSPGSPTRWPKVGGLHNPPIIGLPSTIDLLHQSTETTIRQYVTGNLVTALIFFLAVPLPLWAWISHRHDRTWLLLFFAVIAIFASEAVSIAAMLTSQVSIGLGEFWRSVVDPAIELCWTLFWWQWFGLRDKPWIRAAAWLLMAANVFVGFCLSSPFFGLSFAGQSLLRACSTASLVIFSAQGALLLLLLLEAFRR